MSFDFFSVSKEYLDNRAKHSNFYRLVSAYRTHGHKQADIDPISTSKPSLLPELQLNKYRLNLMDKVCFRGIIFTRQNEGTIEDAVRFLNSTYSGTVGTEFSHLEVIFKFDRIFRCHICVKILKSCVSKIAINLIYTYNQTLKIY